MLFCVALCCFVLFWCVFAFVIFFPLFPSFSCASVCCALCVLRTSAIEEQAERGASGAASLAGGGVLVSGPELGHMGKQGAEDVMAVKAGFLGAWRRA